jgi:GNAT superfamily N-acetyltransferase
VVEAIGGRVRRNRHTAYVVIGVRQVHAGQGIGRRLLAELERWARANGVHRLELTVMTHNERAVALYRRRGIASKERDRPRRSLRTISSMSYAAEFTTAWRFRSFPLGAKSVGHVGIC